MFHSPRRRLCPSSQKPSGLHDGLWFRTARRSSIRAVLSSTRRRGVAEFGAELHVSLRTPPVFTGMVDARKTCFTLRVADYAHLPKNLAACTTVCGSALPAALRSARYCPQRGGAELRSSARSCTFLCELLRFSPGWWTPVRHVSLSASQIMPIFPKT